MNDLRLLEETLEVEAVVELARQVRGARASYRRLALREKLGAGIVRAFGKIAHLDMGRETGGVAGVGGSNHAELICVYWPSAEIDTWLAPEDLEPQDRRARLVAIYRGGVNNEVGQSVFEKCKVISNAGLNYNWSVELFQGNIIRTIRSDGLAWTFDWYPVVERAHPHGTILEDALAEDDHAEALTVAELSIA